MKIIHVPEYVFSLSFHCFFFFVSLDKIQAGGGVSPKPSARSANAKYKYIKRTN